VAVLLAGALFAQGGPGRMRGGSRDGQCQAGASISTAVQPLSAGETATLKRMREEEKLARDVYELLYEAFPVRVFQNIAASG
jgi:hypothetical protein